MIIPKLVLKIIASGDAPRIILDCIVNDTEKLISSIYLPFSAYGMQFAPNSLAVVSV